MTAITAPGFATDRVVASAPRSAGAAAGRLRLTARGRRVVAGLVLLPALFGLGMLAAQPVLAAGAGASAAAELETVTVQPGQSLWQIAASIAEDRDVRDIVIDLKALNALDGSTVEAGQTLVLPADR